MRLPNNSVSASPAYDWLTKHGYGPAATGNALTSPLILSAAGTASPQPPCPVGDASRFP